MSFEQFARRSAIDILGPFSPRFGSLAELIYSDKADKIYSFMSTDKFALLSTSEMNQVLWDEILQRAELCSYLSIERAARLAQGAINAYEEKNLLAWAGSTRGLVESAADTFYVLRYVASTFADHHEAIRICLSGRATEKIVLTKKLEDELIHFTHARVLSAGEAPIAGHNARSAREYISTLSEPDSPDPYTAYQELCNLTHPSAYTVTWMLDDHNQSRENYSFKFNPNREMEYGNILALSWKYRSLFHALLATVMNSALLALVLCASLGRQGTGTNNIDVSKISIWEELSKSISESSKSNINRIITGYYKSGGRK